MDFLIVKLRQSERGWAEKVKAVAEAQDLDKDDDQTKVDIIQRGQSDSLVGYTSPLLLCQGHHDIQKNPEKTEDPCYEQLKDHCLVLVFFCGEELEWIDFNGATKHHAVSGLLYQDLKVDVVVGLLVVNRAGDHHTPTLFVDEAYRREILYFLLLDVKWIVAQVVALA